MSDHTEIEIKRKLAGIYGGRVSQETLDKVWELHGEKLVKAENGILDEAPTPRSLAALERASTEAWQALEAAKATAKPGQIFGDLERAYYKASNELARAQRLAGLAAEKELKERDHAAQQLKFAQEKESAAREIAYGHFLRAGGSDRATFDEMWPGMWKQQLREATREKADATKTDLLKSGRYDSTVG